jgi:SAM-dependent methyltransferase
MNLGMGSLFRITATNTGIKPMSMSTPCPVCGDVQPELFLDGDDGEIRLDSVGSSRTVLSHGRILRCTECGLGYRSFRPREDQLAALYRAADDSMYEAEMPNRWRTAKRHKRIVDKYVPVKGTLLDVGCASGAFLSAMEQAGWQVEGVEPSASQYLRAQKLVGENTRIQQSLLQHADLPVPFDIITLWDVLEHVTEPVEFLKLVASHLKDQGYLVLNVPRIDSIQARILGSRWPLLLAEHLCYFTIPSLRISGESAGLELVQTGQRPSAFSLGYVLFRARQHQIPGVAVVEKLMRSSVMANLSVPVWLGEVYAVFRKTR